MAPLLNPGEPSGFTITRKFLRSSLTSLPKKTGFLSTILFGNDQLIVACAEEDLGEPFLNNFRGT
jgi:hypothetical protein